ncbi:uncharacterized protein LOC127248899 [Andrographis paniculata]|uniref:uncharacterized protein LOC127248899 n=1 Tax=Andrographis paniculata TaxID=175694 RepID=UPI0021E88386|nr:uncharacterized protein LOC127248899 [Andrographis paniculata]
MAFDPPTSASMEGSSPSLRRGFTHSSHRFDLLIDSKLESLKSDFDEVGSTSPESVSVATCEIIPDSELDPEPVDGACSMAVRGRSSLFRVRSSTTHGGIEVARPSCSSTGDVVLDFIPIYCPLVVEPPANFKGGMLCLLNMIL